MDGVIDLCDSDDGRYAPWHQMRKGKSEDDAISILSSDEEMLECFPGTTQESTTARTNAATTDDGGFPRTNAPRHHEAIVARVRASGNGEQNQSLGKNECNGVQAGAPSNLGTIFNRTTAATNRQASFARTITTVNDGWDLPCGSKAAPAPVSHTVAQIKREATSLQIPDRLLKHPRGDIMQKTSKPQNIVLNQFDQYRIKREVKSESDLEDRSEVHARSTSRFHLATTDEDQEAPGSFSPPKITDEMRSKQTAKKSAAGSLPSRSNNLKNSIGGGSQLEYMNVAETVVEDYMQCLLARRKSRLHAETSSDEAGSDDSTCDSIASAAFSSATPQGNGEENELDNTLPQGEGRSIIPVQQDNNRGNQQEESAHDAIYISSDEEGDIGSNLPLRDRDPADATHESFATKEGVVEEKDPSDASRITQSSDSKSTCESDDSGLGDHAVDAGFMGGVDEPVAPCDDEVDSIAPKRRIMHFIDHLCSSDVSRETLLPTSRFSVYGDPDDIIYDFEVHVDKSSIENAGRGAFLKFVGARELKPSRRVLKKESSLGGEIPEPLTALDHKDGFGITVTLTGTQFCDSYRKGFLSRKENYRESDYAPAPRRTFSSLHPNCGTIELGVYGPFRRQDRKTQDQIDIKGFLFSNIPNEWCFGVDEKLKQGSQWKPQVIDITDDVTGEPHDVACRNIPMYVNEVGHDRKLKQTVSALERDEHTVVYYIVICEPMEKGETRELLVAYNNLYEEVRIRKGYAKANIEKGIKSDDHFSTFLKRNFMDRTFITSEVVGQLKPYDLYTIIDWLQSTHNSLVDIMENFMSQAEREIRNGITMNGRRKFRNVPFAQQLVALRRSEWIAKFFRSNLKRYEDTIFTNYTLEAISKLKWSRWKELIVLLSRLQELKDANGKLLHATFEKEIVDELCCDLGDDRITAPMDESLWCGLATSLTRDLCVATAKEIWHHKSYKTSLMYTYAMLARDAVNEILVGRSCDNLVFMPKFEGDCTGLAKDKVKQANQKQSMNTKDNPGEVLSIAFEFDPIKLSGNIHKQLVAVPRARAVGSRDTVNTSWYICWQVLYVMDAFARTFLARSAYTLKALCGTLGVDTKIMEIAIANGLYGQSGMKTRKRKPSFPKLHNPSEKKRKKRVSSSPKIGSFKQTYFWAVIWKSLKEKHGWRIERGGRSSDFYMFPPGVARRIGYKNRVHFFDSVVQVLDFLKTNEKWKNEIALRRLLAEEERCVSLQEKLKTKAWPKFASNDEMVAWVREKAKKSE